MTTKFLLVLSLDRKYQRSRDEQRESPRSRQTAEIYARSCKAQCFTILLRLGLAEQSFFGLDLSRIVLYKQRRPLSGAALQDFQLFTDSPRAHAPRSSHGLPAQPGEDLEVFFFERRHRNTSPCSRVGCVSHARTAGSAGVNEKTAENPRSWPQ